MNRHDGRWQRPRREEEPMNLNISSARDTIENDDFVLWLRAVGEVSEEISFSGHRVTNVAMNFNGNGRERVIRAAIYFYDALPITIFVCRLPS